MKDEDIDYSDIPEVTEDFWKKARLVQLVHLDNDVVDWFKGQGPTYQTRMNRVLRAYMEQHLRKSHKKKSR